MPVLEVCICLKTKALTSLQNRGVNDILIACVDGLTGFPEAINSIYPDTEVQLCVIYQIRNSIKYIASKHHKAFIADLKPVVLQSWRRK